MALINSQDWLVRTIWNMSSTAFLHAYGAASLQGCELYPSTAMHSMALEHPCPWGPPSGMHPFLSHQQGRDDGCVQAAGLYRAFGQQEGNREQLLPAATAIQSLPWWAVPNYLCSPRTTASGLWQLVWGREVGRGTGKEKSAGWANMCAWDRLRKKYMLKIQSKTGARSW